ncbi:uncharacterized protein EV422DRAFT_518614 [Fimicolochytrium jonesii]|uniref:uncharacterized protein n=1 Tax=Fimicolochytrium jonesii TaxID=1396493 RepID=UPI0022FF0E65|nr:uncharacterized protein EV422DRAFT_518614 [Fimicolochytrium jonesii]KAI8824016.1 hypothetical protein EV422DRAFT_518614 [Fimicolochytrium jonesii]
MSFIDTLLASTGTESSTPLMSLITWLLAVEAALILYLSLPFQIKFRRTFAEVLVASPVYVYSSYPARGGWSGPREILDSRWLCFFFFQKVEDGPNGLCDHLCVFDVYPGRHVAALATALGETPHRSVHRGEPLFPKGSVHITPCLARRPRPTHTNIVSDDCVQAKLQRDFFIVSFTGLLAIVTHQVLLMLLRMGRYRKERNVLREQVKELGAVPRSVEGLEGVRGGKVVPKAAPVKKTVVVGGEGSAVPVVKKEI